MPMSNYMHLPLVLFYAEVIDPRQVLDVGVGFGTYGFLLRQYLDSREGEWQSANWNRRFDGIEVFSAYRNPVWSYAYNTVVTADVRSACRTVSSYDLVLCNDILEHLPKQDALDVVSELVSRNRSLIITAPNGFFPQESWGGNLAEAHLCMLGDADFPDAIVRARCGVTTLYLLTRDDVIRNRVMEARSRQPRWVKETRLRQCITKLISHIPIHFSSRSRKC